MTNIDWNKHLRMGRQISGSKTAPKGHVCVFNANICVKAKGKVWFGDVDLTTDAHQLKAMAADAGVFVFILREMDARFTNESDPKYENAVAIIRSDGTLTVLIK